MNSISARFPITAAALIGSRRFPRATAVRDGVQAGDHLIYIAEAGSDHVAGFGDGFRPLLRRGGALHQLGLQPQGRHGRTKLVRGVGHRRRPRGQARASHAGARAGVDRARQAERPSGVGCGGAGAR